MLVSKERKKLEKNEGLNESMSLCLSMERSSQLSYQAKWKPDQL